jgi:UDP-N-acetyl-2-amino-2-deoxyglucuronate dehydrogenase
MQYTPISSRPVRGAIFGYGSIGPVHMDSVRGSAEDRSDRIPDVEIVAVADPVAERSARVPDGIVTFSDYETLLAKTEIDVAHICLPHHMHAPAVIAAAEKGVNIICEKPMALNAPEAQTMLDAVVANGVRFSLISQNRLNPEKAWLKERVTNNELGEIQTLNWVVDWFRSADYYADSGGWRGRDSNARGGALSNQAYHTLDLSMWLADSPVREVTAVTSIDKTVHPEIDVPDRLEGEIVFESGARATFLATVCGDPKDVIRLEAVGRSNGDQRVVILDGASIVEQSIVEETPSFGPQGPVMGKACYGTSHQENIARSYEVFMSGEVEPVGAEDGIRVLKVIDAILSSNGQLVAVK